MASIMAADQALYQAKASGRNCVVSMPQSAQSAHHIAPAIPIIGRRFELVTASAIVTTTGRPARHGASLGYDRAGRDSGPTIDIMDPTSKGDDRVAAALADRLTRHCPRFHWVFAVGASRSRAFPS